MPDMLDLWRSDLAQLLDQRPYPWRRWVKPRVFVLPRWLTRNRLGAWTYYHLIFVTARQAACPPQVRRYVLAHEYGHILKGHIVLHWLWLVAGMLATVATAAPPTMILGMALQGLVIFAASDPKQVIERELSADAVAADLCGAGSALKGARWMALSQGDLDQPHRQQRLAALGELRGAPRA